MKPKILFVDQSGALGGGQLSLLDIAKHYRKICKVILLSDGPFRGMLEKATVPVTVLPAPRTIVGIVRERGVADQIRAVPAVIGVACQIARLAHDYDLIYANTQKAMILAALAGRLGGRPVIWHLRDILSADHFGRTQRWIAVRLANLLVSRVIANSRATAEAFVTAGGDSTRVKVIHNGIDPSPFGHISDRQRAHLRASLGLDREPLVGAFGRFSPWKGQHVLIEALALLPGVHALLVGAALFGEEAYADGLRRRAESMNLADRIHFLGFRDDIPQLMSVAKVVVHTSVAPEPFGRVLVEGMLAKRPVVASQAGGVAEIIEDGTSGVLVPPADPGALAHALADLLNDDAKAGRIAANGQQRAHCHFSLETMLGRIEQEVSLCSRGAALPPKASHGPVCRA
jgi:glycosyltransferase involved in cell wall biosynthesis